MKIERVGAPRVIMDNPMSPHNYFAWPSVCRLRDGRIAAAASGFRLGHICPFGKAVMAVSDDEGQTFSRPAAVIDTPLDDRDAGLLAFGESGVMVTSFNNTREMQRHWNDTDTHGRKGAFHDYVTAYLDTVSDEVEKTYIGATFRISNDNGRTFGPLFKSPITSPHGPCVLADGTILWVGRTFTYEEMPVKPLFEGVEAYTVDPVTGKMEKRGQIAYASEEDFDPAYHEPHAIALPDGRILCHIRVQGTSPRGAVFTTYQSESADGGYTWTLPRPILERDGGAPAHLLLHSSGVLISVYGYRSTPTGIRTAFSDDGGRTWDTGHEIFRDATNYWDLGYPMTVEREDGGLLTVFYAHESRTAPAVIYAQDWRFSR